MPAIHQVLRASVAETTAGLSSARRALRRSAVRARSTAGPSSNRLLDVLRVVSPLGWSVLGVAVACWILGWRFGWVELTLLATGALVLFVGCALLAIGRTRLTVALAVDPRRVRVGGAAAGQVTVRNAARAPLLPVLLELPIGADTARFTLPLLRSGVEHEELFVIPTRHRGVIPIGPATSVRGDPLGLMRREVQWTAALELFVHPVTVPLEPLGAGLLRDLEGQTTIDTSMSDLAFHALREYQPGDDRRFIHWRSSAKAGRFLVRQFLDTRRTHVTTVVDSSAASFGDPEDYELAIACAASIAMRIVLDEQELTVLAGSHTATAAQGGRVLDVFARAELASAGIAELAARASRLAPDTSTAVLITGSMIPFRELQRAAMHFAPEVRVVVLRVDPAAPTGIGGVRGLPVLTVQSLAQLPPLLVGALT